MNAPTSLPEPDAPDPREARAAERLAALRRLRQIGMALSEALLERVSEAVNAREPVDAGAVALEFSRLSRAVRLTLALETRLDGERDVLTAQLAAERVARRDEAEAAREQHLSSRYDCVYDAVTQAIDAETGESGDAERAEQLDEALRERLEDPREDDDLAELPVSILIERICRTLGVAVDWSLWKNADWAVAEWRQALPGSPYAPKVDGSDDGKARFAASGGKASAAGGGLHSRHERPLIPPKASTQVEDPPTGPNITGPPLREPVA